LGDRDERGFYYNVSISGGYFIKDNVANGLTLRYFSQNSFSSNYNPSRGYNDDESNGKTLELNYFIQRFIPVSTNFYFYGKADGGLSKSWNNKIENSVESYNYTENRIAVSLSLGGRYIPKKKFFIDASTSLASLGYNWANIDVGQNSGFGLYNGSIFSNFSIGVGKTF
jgi:hypothetical protein